MSAAWQNFWLNIAFCAAFVAQGFLYTGNWKNWKLASIGLAYWIGALSILAIAAGDFALALGYSEHDYWFLEREFRVVRWRFFLVGSQVFIAMMARFIVWR